MRGRDGAVVRALASHQQMWPGFNSRMLRHMWVDGSHPCFEGFSLDPRVFLPPQKPTLQNSSTPPLSGLLCSKTLPLWNLYFHSPAVNTTSIVIQG